MLLPNLRTQVLEANLDLVRKGLVLSTFGNVSGLARDEGLIVIKPSGVPYSEMKPEHLVVTDMHGKVVEGTLRPSSDLPTHAALYRAFSSVGGIAHSHSEYATAWAQACKSIPCFGTTHADFFHGAIPVTQPMTDDDINGEYELNTGTAIIHALKEIDPTTVPAVLVANHGPFAWGENACKATENAWMLEAVARMSYLTLGIDPLAGDVSSTLLDRHFFRKHGRNAYYGQVRAKE
jgi:L-ribulose-5-phosphate 4-epimerase